MLFKKPKKKLHTLFEYFSKRRIKNNLDIPIQPVFAHTKTKKLPVTGIFLFTVFMTACGVEDTIDHNLDSSLSTPINRMLTGIVAVGLPIKGTISIIDTQGKTLNTQSNTDGTYVVNLGGRPGPYLIRAKPDNSNLPVLYSYATSSGVTNITPLTTLTLFLAYQGGLADSFNNWATIHSNWSRADLEKSHAKINANFATELQNFGADPIVYDFFTVPFEANQTGIDAFLDGYNISFDYSAKKYNITDRSGQPVAFNENIDTADYYIGARFFPEDTADWKLTWTPEFNGQQGKTIVSYPGNKIPWNEERFNEIFWKQMTEIPSQATACNESPNISCNINVRITQLDSRYDVIGNGEVGTLVRGRGTYNSNMDGWFQQDGQSRLSIDKSTTWSFTWSWERIS